jgi:hypothetical protein
VPGTLQLMTLVADQARVVEVRPLREASDSSHPRAARLSPGWRTDSCTLARQQQFAFPRMAGGRLLRTAGGCPSTLNVGGRTGSLAHAGGRTPAQLALRRSKDDEDP